MCIKNPPPSGEGFFIIQYKLHSLWIWSVLVLTRLTILAVEDDQDDCSYKWNQRKQKPPAALSDVVQTTEAKCKPRKKYCKRVNRSKKVEDTDECAKETKNESYDEVE